ncbi:Wzz/FepE/Etk N-terminal domain-containing protein [Methylobacterium sp. J-030]|uniref:Wzz/FepE/Etk N-terminal domain-containing protein n=1 Tax=Methylobacterium sp. J-030 TaxID=2836627 RepID=UPI001FB97EC4|nr:Wzz/FepE/Etk N-terminal domain-containing protein [Methylobacterium sp. J-030]MCJ2070600.1 Wzz/FepE/Etk N-terminal domain-containing protein [Methylobacterium sp. J-030]
MIKHTGSLSWTSGADMRDGNLSYSHPGLPISLIARSISECKFRFAAWVLFCMTLALLYIFLTPPQYSATAAIILNPSLPAGGASGSRAETGAMVGLDNFQAESQIQVLKSERILNAVFDKLNLLESKSIAENIKDSDKLRSNLSSKNAAEDSASVKSSNRKAFEAFSNRVNVKRVGNSYVLEVSYQALEPAESARIANAICMQYIASQVELRAASIQRGTEYLQGRIASMKAQLAAADEGVRTGAVPNFQFPDADAQIISAAAPPLTRSSPKTGTTFAITLTLSLLIGISTIVVREFFDNSVKSPSQIKYLLDINNVVELPRFSRSIRVGAASNKNYDILRQAWGKNYLDARQKMDAFHIDFALDLSAKQKKVIGVMCWTGHSKRHLLALLLASVVSAKGRSAAVFNLDYQKAKDGFFSSSGNNDHGARIVTSSDVKLVIDPQIDGASGQKDIDLSNGANSAATLHILSEYDAEYVLLDLPPVSSNPEMLLSCAVLDYVVVIVELGKTQLAHVERVTSTLRNNGVSGIGVIALNA